MITEFIAHQDVIHADEIAPGAPLKQSEISRFIRAVDAEDFKKNDNGLTKLEGQFKAKSLLDLAKEAAEREPVIVSAPSQTAPREEVEQLDLEPPILAPEDAEKIDRLPQDTTNRSGAADLAETGPVAPDELDENISPPGNPDVDGDPQEHLQGAKPETVEPAASISLADYETAKTQAYDRGLEAGKQQVRDEVEEMMSHALGLLENTVTAFAEQADGAVEVLARTIEQSIISLASSRAGAQIETTPKAFAARIQKLVERMGTATQSPIIRLHPSDVIVLTSVLEQSSSLLNLRLVSDDTLQRGDVELSLEGVQLTDVLPRIDTTTAVVEYVPLKLADDALLGAEKDNSMDYVDEKALVTEQNEAFIGPRLPNADKAENLDR